MFGGVPVARIRIVSVRREPLAKLLEDSRYACTELAREGDLWADVHEFVALFRKLKWGDPYRVEFRLVERLICSRGDAVRHRR